MSINESSWVYILANQPRGAIYIGVTTDLIGRVGEHREGLTKGHAQKYKIKTLVYYEEHGSIRLAIEREKRLKRWRRVWKTELIEAMNPAWRDLWYELLEDPGLDPLRFPSAGGAREQILATTDRVSKPTVD